MAYRGGWFLSLGLSLILGSAAQGAGLILNEYNSVGNTDLLADSNFDSYFGRIEGNGREEG